MATFKGKIKDCFVTFDKKFIITLETSYNNLTEDTIYQYSLGSVEKTEYDVTIEKHREPRSLNANNYCWKLLDLIADKVNSTKEEVYKKAVREVGVFEMLPIKNTALTEFKRRWASKGLGWFCEELRDSKLAGYTTVMAYFGSSTYNSKEMSRLLDYVVEEAKELSIDVRTPEEIEKIKKLWESNCV